MISIADRTAGSEAGTESEKATRDGGMTPSSAAPMPVLARDPRGVSAATQPWNSATTLFIARQLAALGGGRPLAVLDVGCGDGAALALLANLGHDMCGYDLASRSESLRRRLGVRLGAEFEDRIRIAPDERTIPFDDNAFDVIYANQVFEHVRFFDKIVSECARVLRPGGALVALFPLATDPIEPHLRIPFAHWVPPGGFRRACFWPFYALRLRPRGAGETARQASRRQDESLADGVYYRFMNEVRAVMLHYFASMDVETGDYLRAKIDLLRGRPSRLPRLAAAALDAVDTPALAWLATHLMCSALVIRDPRK
jgi:SAM-dependent methyltransferase